MSRFILALIFIGIIAVIFYIGLPFLVASIEYDKIEESNLTNIDESKPSEFICNNSDLTLYHQAEKQTKPLSKTIYVKGNVTNNGKNTIYFPTISVKYYDKGGSIIKLNDDEPERQFIYLKPWETKNFIIMDKINIVNWNYPNFPKVEKYRIIISN